MENASKALIIAGSVLIALMIIAALILMFTNLSSYQETNIQNTKEAQIIEFNNQFETYNRENVRGSDMISLMNRIIDYNSRKSDDTDIQFRRMEIEISNIVIANFSYNSGTNLLIKKDKYTEKDINLILDPVKKLEEEYGAKNITQLSANISNVMLNNKTEAEEKVKQLIPSKILAQKGIEKIKQDTAKYYEYTQFKRTYFNSVTSRKQWNKI